MPGVVVEGCLPDVAMFWTSFLCISTVRLCDFCDLDCGMMSGMIVKIFLAIYLPRLGVKHLKPPPTAVHSGV